MQQRSDILEPQKSHAAFALSRRGFLHLGTAATAILSIASAASMSGCSREEELQTDGYRPVKLTAREFVVLTAFCRSMLNAPGHLSADEAGVAKRIDTELSFHPGDRLLDDVKGALLVLEHGPFLDGYFKRFTQLAAAAQERYLHGLLTSRFQFRRDALNGLRLLTTFFYYTDERTWKDIGYSGPLVARKLPESANAIEVIA